MSDLTLGLIAAAGWFVLSLLLAPVVGRFCGYGDHQAPARRSAGGTDVQGTAPLLRRGRVDHPTPARSTRVRGSGTHHY